MCVCVFKNVFTRYGRLNAVYFIVTCVTDLFCCLCDHGTVPDITFFVQALL